ncbi:MAG: hypothetical protein WAV85_16005 [Rhodoferax sp.]
MTVAQLSKGERLHEFAQAELASAHDLLSQNTERVNDAKARLEEITQRRVGGTSTEKDAAEYAALQGDLVLLEKMWGSAQAAHAQAIENVHGAFVYWTDAKRAHDLEQAEALFQALQQKCREIEAVFIQCLGEVGRAGQAIGISTMGSAYPKSNAIRKIFDLNITPTEGA